MLHKGHFERVTVWRGEEETKQWEQTEFNEAVSTRVRKGEGILRMSEPAGRSVTAARPFP